MPSDREPLTERHVARAFRALASQHARDREPLDKRRAWQRIEQARREVRLLAPAEPRWRAALAVAVFAVGAGLGSAYWRASAALHYEAQGAALIDGNLSAGATPARIEFSDSSTIVASPHSAFSLDVVGKHAALARLVQGDLHVSVHHASDTNWHFFAGRYEVQVVGTEFDLSWNAKTEALSLVMISGQVRVLGGPGAARLVKAGEHLVLPETAPASSPATPATPAAEAVAASEQTSGGPTGTNAALDTPAPGKAALASATASGGHPPAALDWGALLQAGQFAAVLQSAEAQGLEHALKSASASDLKALAQAARYTGHGALSLRAWRALRERFASQALGAQASFFLGRTYDEQGNAPEALRWLSTYATEAPSGVYASEALGRKLLLVSKIYGRSAALPNAREYLSRFPEGAYAKTARALVEPE